MLNFHLCAKYGPIKAINFVQGQENPFSAFWLWTQDLNDLRCQINGGIRIAPNVMAILIGQR